MILNELQDNNSLVSVIEFKKPRESVQQSNILQQQEFTSRVPVSISNRIPDQFG